ncbi:hypothetical protein NESM_000415400 [Novymonas esmeraldas]|uniref:DUF393 domain-containing protein n=1 Tax=Novymonas esmeraldas TaxID=1808958 RepID=A0AAW0EN09_9TRYP
MKRFSGSHYRQLLTRLPRNLLIFDGHCLLCQARVRYVLERNFSFFSLMNYATSEVEKEMSAGLDRHRIHCASLHSQEGTDVRRSFLHSRASSSSSTSSSSASPPTTLPEPEDLVLLCIEKVPSRAASFLARARPRGVAADDRALFHTGGGATAASPSRASASTAATSSARLVTADETDLLVSTNYLAMCRVGMHLDRTLTRALFRLVYTVVPTAVGDWWFSRYVCGRRRRLWGTSEQDAAVEDGIIDGMRERRWTWRSAHRAARR